MSFLFFYFLIIFLLSACWGSFLHLCIVRIIKKESIILPGSHCMNCEKTLNFFDNIPLFSWILLKGRCRYCNKKISIGYLITEIITIIIFLFLGFIYLFDWVLVAYIFLCSFLIIGSGVDFQERWIPDTVTVGLLFSGLLFSFLIPDLHAEMDRSSSLLDSFFGLIVGSSLLFIIGYIGKAILRRDAMGMGDVKLLGAIGTFLGWHGVLFTIFFASVIALMFYIIKFLFFKETIETEIPFGPYLSAASVLWILWGIDWFRTFTDSLILY